MNRGPAGNSNSNNRGPGGNANNRGQAGNANKGGPGGNANNRAGGNANTNNRGGAGNANNNRGGANQGNRGPGGANANKGGPAGNRGPGGANAGNKGPGANRPGAPNNRKQPAGAKTVSMKNGGSATFRKDGKVRTIQTKNMTVNRGMRGERHVVAERNGRRVVAMGRHGGYSQRAYYRNGNRVYVQRTYYVGGRSYAYAYRSYYYGGYPYYGYAPAYYYGPAYYGWAYNPWPAPVYYNWGWAGQPWYGYYGPYYQPYPSYPYASLWLTDYMFSAQLQAAYAAGQASVQGENAPPQLGPESSELTASLWSSDPLIAAGLEAAYGPGLYLLAGAADAKSPQMSAEVKQAIADQIKKEIDAEKNAAVNKGQAASGGEEVPAALDPNIRYFVVSSNLDVTSEGEECTLTPGDVIYRDDDTPDDDKMVDAVVKSAKKDECAVGAKIGVSVDDLQEMHNNLRQTMDEGLKKLAENSGKNGLPAAPDTKTTAGEVPAPSADKNVQSDLDQTQKDADQAEQDAQQSN